MTRTNGGVAGCDAHRAHCLPDANGCDLLTHPQPVVTEVAGQISNAVLVADDNEDAADTIGLLFAEPDARSHRLTPASRRCEKRRHSAGGRLRPGMPDPTGREVCGRFCL